MSTGNPSGFDLGLVDAAFGVLVLVSLALVVVAQLAWILVFDATGLDTLAPDPLFTTVGPALSVALVPTAVAAGRYSRRTAAVVGAAIVAAAIVVAAYTVRLYALCGPGC